MSKVLVVFGATGQQGGSVIRSVLNDPELAPKYKIRAITRDLNAPKALQLKERVEVVYGDVQDRPSIQAALAGAHVAFAMTTPSFTPDGAEAEFQAAKTIADVAVEQALDYLIFSTLPSIKEVSGGKYDRVGHFEAKARAEQYIRHLPIKSAFFAPGFFMENFGAMPFLAPQKQADGTWALCYPNQAQALWPMIDITDDTGKFTGAILAAPEKYQGKTFCAATALYSMKEAAAALSTATGKTVAYKQISLDEFKKQVSFAADAIAGAFSYHEEFGYYGPDTKNQVAWAVENARGKLTTLDEFLKTHPISLE